MNAVIEITEDDLNRFIDGEADPDTRRRVEAHLADHPEEAERVRRIREDMARLRRHFTTMEAHVSDRHLADTVGMIVDHAPPRRVVGMEVGMRVAAMLVVAVVGSAAVFGIKLSMSVPAFADAAALAYLDVAREATPPGAPAQQDPGTLVQWLKRETGLDIHVPFAEEHGFRLTAGKLAQFDHHAAVLLVYEDGRHHRVVVFATQVRDRDDPKPHFTVDRSAHINWWSRRGVGLVIAAGDKRDLEEFSHAAMSRIDVSTLQ